MCCLARRSPPLSMNFIVQLEEFETQKENIEPLKEGRSATALLGAFVSDSQTVQKGFDEEHRLFRQHVGQAQKQDDPLEAYDKYIRWTLEAYPQGHNQESRLVDLLEETVRAFQDDTRYRADVRYLKWCILYARYLERPDDIYMHLLSNGIGVEYSALYEAYCQWLEKSGRPEKAAQIYELGLQRDTKPSGRLLKHYNQFQRRKIQPQGAGEGSARIALRNVHGDGVDPRQAAILERKPKARIEVLVEECPGSEGVSLASSGSSLPKRQLVRKENLRLPGSASGSLLPQSCTRTPKATKIKVFQDELTQDLYNGDIEHFPKFPIAKQDQMLSIEERRAQHRGLLGKTFVDILADGVTPAYSPSETILSEPKMRSYSTSALEEIQTDVKTSRKGFAMPSPTINTKAALADIIDIFSQPLKRLKLDPPSDLDDASSFVNAQISTHSLSMTPEEYPKDDKPRPTSPFLPSDPISDTESDSVSDHDNTTKTSRIKQTSPFSRDSSSNIYAKFQFMTPIQERTEPISEITRIPTLLSPSSHGPPFTPSEEKPEDISLSSHILENGTLNKTSSPMHPDVIVRGSFVDMRHAKADEMANLDRLADDENEPRSRQSLYTLNLGDESFQILKKVTDGGFGTVYLAVKEGADEQEMAIKVEKPTNCWEYDILITSASRLPQDRQESIIQPIKLYAFADESFLVMPYGRFGTLIDMVNVCGSTGLDELLVMFYAIELLHVVEDLHTAGIIHGDLKADNCLVRFKDCDEWDKNYLRNAHGGWSAKGICLIDFGRAIDMRAHANGTEFVADWPSDKHDCPEVQEGRPWSYEIDCFGIAAIVHTMLFGCYIETMPIAQGTRHAITRPLKRYWQTSIWQNLFDVLINAKSLRGNDDYHNVKDLARLREQLEDYLEMNHTRHGKSLRGLLTKCEAALLERVVT